MQHAFAIGAITAAILLATLLPFLPGEYDRLAVPLSMMARVFGLLGLAIVPLAFTRAGRVALASVGALVACTAFPLGGAILGLVSVAAWMLVVLKVRPRIPPLYLLIVPLAVFALQWLLVGPAVERSRDRAIANAAALIADIEAYRAERGEYPVSLLSIHRDYKPSVIGVDRYHYERKGDAYNVLFHQPAARLTTGEWVAYNPRDEQHVNAHPMDILQYTPEHLERTRGFFASGALPQPHWKYFWFD